MTPYIPPSLREQLGALVLAAACALAFLGAGVLPARALVPYPPEVLEPVRSTAIAQGMAEADIFRGNLGMGDKYNQSLAWDRILMDRLRAGELPLWTRDIGGGAPFVPQMAQVFHPVNLLLLVLPSTGWYGVWYLLHMVAFGYFAYRFLRRVEVSHGAALFGMVALLLGLWTQARVHHNVMLSAVVPLFAMLSCVHHLVVHRGGLGHVALLALGTGLSWLSGFPPASLMCAYLCCAFALVLACRAPRDSVPGLLHCGAGLALGLLLAAAQIVPVLLAAQVTSRGAATTELLASKALEPAHLLTAVWPTLFTWPAEYIVAGGRALPSFAAELAGLVREDAAFNYPETAFAIGIAPLCCACASLGRRLAWFFAGAALFGLAMASGWLLPGSRLLPGAHSGDLKRFVLLFGVCAPVAAAIGLDRVLARGRLAVPLVAGAAGLIALASLAAFAFHLQSAGSLQELYGGMIERRHGAPAGTVAEWAKAYPGHGPANRAHLLFLSGIAALGALATMLAAAGRLGPAVPVLVAATAGELLLLGSGTIVAVPRERLAMPALLQPVRDAAEQSGVRPRFQRLMPPDDADPLHYPAPPNLAGFFGVEDLGAYNPLPKLRMEEVFLALEPDRKDKVSVAFGGVGVGALRDEASLTHPLADLLGIEWIASRAPLSARGLEEHLPADASGFHLYRRTTCLPRATFVSRREVIADRAARLARLAQRDHDPRAVVLLEQADAPAPEGDPAASVTIAEHRDELVRIRVRAAASGYLRLADPYDPGWTATIDGWPTRVYAADHYLRAVFVPAGDHVVEFRYDALRMRLPLHCSVVALAATGVLLVLGLRRRRDG